MYLNRNKELNYFLVFILNQTFILNVALLNSPSTHKRTEILRQRGQYLFLIGDRGLV